jgi:DNA-binding beta-propeller fold protein YncE
MSTKAQRLKDLIDTAVCDVTTRYRDLLMDRIQQQKRKMYRRLSHIQKYEDKYEQSANRAIQFLVFIKTSRVPQIKDTPNAPQHLLLSLTEGFNMEDVSQLLRGIPEIQMSTGKRQVRIEECVKLMSTPVQHASVCLAGVYRVFHISRVTSDRFWVSGYNDNLILTDTTGVTIHRVTGIESPLYGGHTVNSGGELIYIDRKRNINKLSTDNTTVTTLLEYTSSWRPYGVYCSPTTGHLMVAMCNRGTAKVTVYSDQLQPVQTIQHDNTGHSLYGVPQYITENRNSDIIVSDYSRGVVVTERGGRHRFSYTGPPSGSGLNPRGICTDALSHILVCDYITDTVQMIDKDGHFLSLLLTPQQHGIYTPLGLKYDDKTHLLLVGSDDDNRVRVYRYIHRRYSVTGKY